MRELIALCRAIQTFQKDRAGNIINQTIPSFTLGSKVLNVFNIVNFSIPDKKGLNYLTPLKRCNTGGCF